MKIEIVLALALVISTSLVDFGQGAKILSIFPYPGPSQYIYISALLKALAERGHEVTSISTYPQKEKLKNFRDVAVMENIHLFEGFIEEAASGEKKSYIQEFLELAEPGKLVVTNVLENAEVKKIMKNEKFDLIISEVLVSEALLGLGEHFKAPIVAVSTFGTINFIDYLVGNTSPLSYIPHISVPYGNHMSLKERAANLLMETVDQLCFNHFVLPLQEEIYRKYFPSAQLSLDQARKNVSLVLLNDHFTLRFPRPYVPNMIEVGGLHVKANPDPLTEDLQEYLDKASEGVIYFSLGSNIQSKDLSSNSLKVLLEGFRELKIKVLWKFEAEDLPGKPDNVLIRKWFNQPAILAHPNVKLFISHGGYMSTIETIFHGTPVLGLPIIADQFMNVKNAVKAGYALELQLNEMTKDSFKKTIKELWSNPKYSEAVGRLSKRYRDQPMTPLETAIYWVEYVLRNEGAPYMRNAGQDLSFMEYHNLDVFLLLAAGVILIFVVIFYAICSLKKMCFKAGKVSKNSKKDKLKKR
ncbi:UDP-glucosyltransferase 2 [Stomoxys calcitrans]|uniref:UDP-glucosyltransferase 2 n=1 Tax=Stomoxys calcitrans TaxID=35570 RepID=UPI0027E2815A|nr:UDP-glucosyltransferase 2 [Stomoxys calcitrans]